MPPTPDELAAHVKAVKAFNRARQRTSDSNRQKRRALVKSIGKRQFKKLFQKVQA